MKCQGMADEGGWGQVGTLLTGLTLQTGGTCRARLQDEGAGEAGGGCDTQRNINTAEGEPHMSDVRIWNIIRNG